MKTAVTMMSVNKYFQEGKIDIKGFIEFCRDINVDGADLLEYYWKDKESEIKKIPQWIEENGLVIPCFGIGNNFAVTTENEMQKQVDYIKQGVDTALKLGVNKLRIFGGHIDNRMSKTEGLNKVKEGIERCLPYAEENRIIFVLENHGDLPGLCHEVKGIIGKFNSPYLRCNLDIGNFMNKIGKKEDPVFATKNLIDYVSHVHVKDAKYYNEPRPGACIAGEGIIPIKECLQILKDNNYQGYLSLEFEDRTVDDIEGTKKSMDFIKKALASLK